MSWNIISEFFIHRFGNKIKNSFITDNKGHKIAAIIEIEELERLKEIIEDLSDIKAFKGKKNVDLVQKDFSIFETSQL